MRKSVWKIKLESVAGLSLHRDYWIIGAGTLPVSTAGDQQEETKEGFRTLDSTGKDNKAIWL